MAKTLLRSGDLDDFQAVGGGGQAVFDSALQIREALRLRKQQALVDCLAIPQVNDEGDRVDWYSPIDGQSRSWKAAEPEARARALRFLESTLDSAAALSRKCMQSPKTAQQLFGSLLEKALQFPDENHVFLVDGKPVITFWGFVDAQARSRDDALACLRDTLEENLPVALVEPLPELPAAPVIAEPVMIAEPEPEPEAMAEPLPVAAPVEAQPVMPVAARRRFRVWYLLPPVAIAAAVMVAVLLHRSEPVKTPVATAKPASAPATVSTPAPAATPAPVAATPSVTPPAERAAPEKLPESQPQKPANTTTDTAPATSSATLATTVTAPVPAKPDDLIVTPDAVRDGQVRVIDGRWRVTIDQMPTPTGKPPVMRFQFKNGKGSVQIAQGNTTCKADVSAAMTSAGNLVIESRYTAKCQNNSRYRMPLLVCHASIGAAVCEAQYADDRVFPMTIKRESK